MQQDQAARAKAADEGKAVSSAQAGEGKAVPAARAKAAAMPSSATSDKPGKLETGSSQVHNQSTSDSPRQHLPSTAKGDAAAKQNADQQLCSASATNTNTSKHGAQHNDDRYDKRLPSGTNAVLKVVLIAAPCCITSLRLPQCNTSGHTIKGLRTQH